MEELVSVIIPLYNSELFIYETIKSIIDQTYRNIEIIIIDDGSIDNSAEIVNKIIKEYSKDTIRYYYQPNSGVSVARNNGIKKSKGKYIAFLDSDDLWVKTKLEKQIKELERTKGKVCYCGYSQYLDNGKIIKKEKISFVEGNILIDILKEKTGGYTGTWVIDKNTILDNSIWFDEALSWGEDTEFFIKICALAEVCYVDDYLAFYRIRGNSLTTGKSCLSKIDEIEIWIGLLAWMEENINRLIYKDIKTIRSLLIGFRIPNSIVKHIYNFMKKATKMEVKDNYYKIIKIQSDNLKKLRFNNGFKTIRICIKLILLNLKLYKYKLNL
ncbi:MAG: glycosyltransferase family 2 protein [Clostridiaceae bacterium]